MMKVSPTGVTKTKTGLGLLGLDWSWTGAF